MRDIFCGNCKTKVATYDGKATINIVANCPKCRYRVVYHPDTGRTETKKQSLRETSSGLRY